jgi:hypothetical protein
LSVAGYSIDRSVTMANRKEFSGAKEPDLRRVLQEAFYAVGLDVRLEIHTSPTQAGKYWIEVLTWELGGEPNGYSTYRTRHPLNLTDPNRIITQLMRACFDHWARIEADPWKLPSHKRREIRGE